MLAPGETRAVYLRLTDVAPAAEPFGRAFDALLEPAAARGDEFYATVVDASCSEDARRGGAPGLCRDALEQAVLSPRREALARRRSRPADAAAAALARRNAQWTHLYNADVVSMPDKWEYPWYAAWDLAFHTIALAPIDPDFAKSQLILFLREWYLHPNGQIPAYEWAFGDVNPPVHAWPCGACTRSTAA